jgi:hypothetical protein
MHSTRSSFRRHLHSTTRRRNTLHQEFPTTRAHSWFVLLLDLVLPAALSYFYLPRDLQSFMGRFEMRPIDSLHPPTLVNRRRRRMEQLLTRQHILARSFGNTYGVFGKKSIHQTNHGDQACGLLLIFIFILHGMGKDYCFQTKIPLFQGFCLDYTRRPEDLRRNFFLIHTFFEGE